jgi:sugar phosphate isomerase/epimerase
MDLTRREMLAACGGAFAGLQYLAAEEPKPAPKRRMGVVIHSYSIRNTADRAREAAVRLSDPLNFLDYCHQRGAGGVQLAIPTLDKQSIAKLRAKLEATGMYLEGSIALPKDRADVERFTGEVRIAKEAGASVLRCAMSGRRYEIFDTADAFRQFAERAYQSLGLAEPVVARTDMRLAIENHKDWLMFELVGMVKKISSKYVGVTVDTGNSIALLEDPMEVVETYAPWVLTTHIKDMGVQEYDAGFLLSEVPLGKGFLDLKKIIRVLRDARPEIRFNLEMITRDPLKVPCLTPKYWATLDKLPAKQLAQALSLVRKVAAKEPLPQVNGLTLEKKLELEDRNVRQSLMYASQLLGL